MIRKSLVWCGLALVGCQDDLMSAAYQDPGNNGNNWVPGGPSTNVSLGGAQDFGYFRRLLEAGQIPTPESLDAAGFFAEHHTELPAAACGERICLQAMLGAMSNLADGRGCTMLQLGFNSPLTIDPRSRPPLTLALAVDLSGSMADQGKIDFVRSGLERLILGLRDDDRIAIVGYSSTAALLLPIGELLDTRPQAVALAQHLEAEGGTNISAGLELAYRQIQAEYDSGRQNRVILLSDGQPTEGLTDPQQILALSKAFNSDGIGITSIGLGTSFNIELMRGLAEQADGNFYFVEDAAAVEEVFGQELEYFTMPVGFDLSLKLRAGRDFGLLRSYGSRFFETTTENGTLEVPSVFLAHRRAHDDVTPEGGRRGGGSALLVELMPRATQEPEPASSEVAIVDLEFREPGTNRIVSDSVRVELPGSAWFLPEGGFFQNTIVEKSFVMLNVFVTLESATALARAGQGEAAIAVLRRVIAAAADYEDGAHEGAGDADIESDIALMDQLIGVIRATGAPEPGQVEIPENPWPRD